MSRRSWVVVGAPLAVLIATAWSLLRAPGPVASPGPAAASFGERVTDVDVGQPLAEADLEALVHVAREALEASAAGQASVEAPPGPRQAHVTWLLGGRVQGGAAATGADLSEAVRAAATRAATGALVAARAEADVFIELYGPARDYHPETFAPGLHALTLRRGDQTATVPAAEAVRTNRRPARLIDRLCASVGAKAGCQARRDVRLEMALTVQFGSFHRDRGSPGLVRFYRGRAARAEGPEAIPAFERSLRRRLVNDLRAKGQFRYGYSPSRGRASRENNAIRQWMAARTLARMARDDESLVAAHRRNLEALLQAWYREHDGRGYIEHAGDTKLGATAMALRTIVASPLYPEHRERAAALGATIVACQGADGALRPFYREPRRPYDARRLEQFYSGEGILALLELHARSGDARWLAAARRSVEHYLVKYVEQQEAHYYPAYVPWHTMALHALYRVDRDPRYPAAAFRLNDELIRIQNTDGKPWTDLLGRFFDPRFPQYGSPHASSDAVYVDGLVHAWALAREVGDEGHARTYARAVDLGLRNLMRLQFREDDAWYLSHPERVVGGVRTHVHDNRLRIDTTQHTLDAVLALRETGALLE